MGLPNGDERGYRSDGCAAQVKTDTPSLPAQLLEDDQISSRDSLGDVLGLPAGAEVRAALPLVVGVNHGATSGILKALLSSAHYHLLAALLLLDLRGLVSDLTIAGHRSVLLSHVLNF